MAVDQLSWDPPHIDEMIVGCEHGGVSNPDVEILVENLVEEVTPSQKQKRTADTVKPNKKPRSKKGRKKEKDVEVGDNPYEPSFCDKEVESGSQQMAVDPLSGDAPHTDEVIVGCEQGGLSNPNVEIHVENLVEEATSSQTQKRTAEPNKPVKEARSTRVKGGLYGCLSVPDA